MPTYCDPDYVEDYVLRSERELPPEEQVPFKLGSPTGEEADRMADFVLSKMTDGETNMAAFIPSAAEQRFALRACLKGWGPWTHKGKEIKYESNGDGKPTDATLNKLSLGNRLELSVACYMRQLVPETDRD